MKSKYLQAGMLVVVGVGLALMTGCVVYPNGRVRVAPVVVETAPPPPPPEPVYIPDDYVWDGYEYVGIVGGQYYYLGPGEVWLFAEPWRLERFHGWERGHPDWRVHLAVRNERYRRDVHGRVHERERREDHR